MFSAAMLEGICTIPSKFPRDHQLLVLHRLMSSVLVEVHIFQIYKSSFDPAHVSTESFRYVRSRARIPSLNSTLTQVAKMIWRTYPDSEKVEVSEAQLDPDSDSGSDF